MLHKIIIALLLGCFVMWIVFFAWIHLSYAANLPSKPDDKTGRIYQMVVNHGSMRYGTERDVRTLRIAGESQPFAIVLFFAAGILGFRWGIFHIRGQDRKIPTG
jgi:hypothetical protein